MSVTRKVDLGTLDLVIMEEVASELGYRIGRNVKTRLYRENQDADLVVRDIGAGRDLGFKIEDGRVNVIYDDMDTHAYSRIISTYAERMITRRARGRFKVEERTEDAYKIRLRVRR